MELVRKLRWLRKTGVQIAHSLRMARSTVSRILRQLGLSRIAALEPVEPPRRYEWGRPGDMIHIDIKKLAKIRQVGHRIHGDRSRKVTGHGWEFVYVCVDDRSRMAYVEILPDETGATAEGFLRRCTKWFRRLGVKVKRVMTDNGSGFISKVFAACCQQLRMRHIRTKPYTPRTNGKAERFIQTMLREWAYGRAYTHSRYRTQALAHWLRFYNLKRPHSAVGGLPPITRI